MGKIKQTYKVKYRKSKTKKDSKVIAIKIRKIIKICVVVSVIIKIQNGRSLGHKNCNILKSKVSRIRPVYKQLTSGEFSLIS